MLVASLVAGGVATSALAASSPSGWPQAGGGSAHTANARGETTISPANVGTLHVAWSHAFPNSSFGAPYVSAPSVADGRVFVQVMNPAQVWAFRESDGAPIWHHALAPASFQSFQGSTQPAIDHGRLFAQGPSKLWTFDAATGAVIWTRKDTGSEPPVTAGGLVYIADRGLAAPSISAYSESDGHLVWRRAVAPYSLAPPAIAGGVAYTAGWDGAGSTTNRDSYALTALDATTGRLLWVRHPPLNGTELPNGVVAIPSVSGGVVYDGDLDAYSTSGKLLWVNNPPGGGSSTTPAVGRGLVYAGIGGFDQVGPECAFRQSDGHLVWCQDDSIYDNSSYANGVIVIVEGGIPCLTAADAKTGRLLFADQNHIITGQPAIVDGTVFASGWFKLFAFRPAN
jgi:outer membrane protein assembly factor BamB